MQILVVEAERDAVDAVEPGLVMKVVGVDFLMVAALYP